LSNKSLGHPYYVVDLEMGELLMIAMKPNCERFRPLSETLNIDLDMSKFPSQKGKEELGFPA
jgi:hypothetical protein